MPDVRTIEYEGKVYVLLEDLAGIVHDFHAMVESFKTMVDAGPQDWAEEEIAVPDRFFTPEPENVAVQNPCGICGAEAAWRDVHGQWGCNEHLPTHEAWKTAWERAEIWMSQGREQDPNDQRWYGRILRGDGSVGVAIDRGYTQEAAIIAMIEENFPTVTIHLIRDEFDDSRRDRKGPPVRLWDRGVS